MQFRSVSEIFEQIESTSARLTITRLLAQLFKTLSPDELEKTIYLLQGRVVPLFEKEEFGMAEKSVVKCIIKTFGLDSHEFRKTVQKVGDLGKAVEAHKSQVLTLDVSLHEPSVLEVYNTLRLIAETGGTGSQEKKSVYLGNLLRQLDPRSCRYVVRIVLSTIRLGFSDMTILDALSWMITGDKRIRPQLLKGYQLRPDLGYIAKIVKQEGENAVDDITPTLFTPIIMMRAERLNRADDIIAQIGTCYIEPKYDGFRVQIHYAKKENKVRIYSRNLEDVTAMFPDIAEAVRNEVHVQSLIIEGEAVGYNPHTKQLVAFQETVQRKRKYNIADKAKELPLKIFVFELLFADGKSYLEVPFEKRRNILSTIIAPGESLEKKSVLLINDSLVSEAPALESLFESAVGEGQEGIIAKKSDGIYQPGARGWNWIKYKKQYTSVIQDTIDCLVMGYDAGKGKRTDFGLGAFLVGVYDKRNDMYVTVAKIGTGLSDKEWQELFKQCQPLRVGKKPMQYEVDKQMTVDQWVTPQLVVEIRADEITKSSVHTAGRVLEPSKSGQSLKVKEPGFALRFPRLERFRDDKSPPDITTVEELRKMTDAQLR